MSHQNNCNRNVIWSLLLIVFFCHGILYFWSIVPYYSYDNPIKLIKYVLLLVAITMLLFYRKRIFDKDVIPISIIVFMVTCAFIAHANFDNYLVLINYCAPVCSLLLYPTINSKVNVYMILMITYYVSSVFGYVEFCFLDGIFSRFSDAGYRVCSIFVNPNNYGAFLFLTTTICLMKEKNILVKILILCNTYILLGMTGSRSGLIIMTLSMLILIGYVLLKKWLSNDYRIFLDWKKIVIVMVGFAVLNCLCFVFVDSLIDKIGELLEGGRNLNDIDLKVGRAEQYSRFLGRSDFNVLFPNFFDDVYTDNIFLHIWGFFGLPGLLLYLMFSIVMIYNLYVCEKKKCLLFCLLFIFGIFENYLYLWPIAYIYWYIVGAICYRRIDV